MIDLPYFDLLLEGRRRGEPAAKVFERYVHWGYWENPAQATRDAAEFSAAMDRLNGEIVAAAGLEDGQAVLDAGCGFGGTLAAIGARWRGMRLTGINIDARQLAVARAQVPDASFVEGDACALPFEAGSFDRALAVECIFHFPSRLGFLKEAARVLKPGGRLALSDFIPWTTAGSGSRLGRAVEKRIAKGYGEMGGGWGDGDYEAMARAAGLRVTLDRDVTANTLPTYPVLLDLLGRRAPGEPASLMAGPTRLLEWASRLRLVRYRIIGFAKD